MSVPADSSAEVIAAKSAAEAAKARPFDTHSEDVRVAVSEWLERIKSGSDIRQKDGKEPLSDARRELVAAVSGSLRMAADEVEALLTPPAPPVPVERLHLGMELTRRRLQRHGISLIGATP